MLPDATDLVAEVPELPVPFGQDQHLRVEALPFHLLGHHVRDDNFHPAPEDAGQVLFLDAPLPGRADQPEQEAPQENHPFSKMRSVPPRNAFHKGSPCLRR